MSRVCPVFFLLVGISLFGCGSSTPNKPPKTETPITANNTAASKNVGNPNGVNITEQAQRRIADYRAREGARLEAVAANANAVDAAASSGVLDEKLPAYAKSADAVTGTIKSKGSDTMVNLMNYWVEGFKTVYPGVNAEVEHKGSGDAPKALIEDQATFGAMSRDWEPSELDKFQAAHGYQPTVVPTCIDMLAVYVHKDNPIKGLSLQQVDAIFSKERKGGYAREIKTWGDAGITDPEWTDKPITLYGRNTTSGTYKYFKDHALFKGTFKDTYQERPGSSGVIGAIASDKYGIGYSGIGYSSAGVRVVPLATKEGNDFVPAEPKFAYDESYPLARYLYVSFKRKPGEPIDPLRREFLKFVLSKEGQALVVKDSYLPLPADEAAETIKTLEAK